jgi:hypothetical protein
MKSTGSPRRSADSMAELLAAVRQLVAEAALEDLPAVAGRLREAEVLAEVAPTRSAGRAGDPMASGPKARRPKWRLVTDSRQVSRQVYRPWYFGTCKLLSTGGGVRIRTGE